MELNCMRSIRGISAESNTWHITASSRFTGTDVSTRILTQCPRPHCSPPSRQAACKTSMLRDRNQNFQGTLFVAPAPQRDFISPFKDNGCRRRCLLQVTAASTPRSLGDPSKIGWNPPARTWRFPPASLQWQLGVKPGERGSFTLPPGEGTLSTS